jgi:hypothetical protein
VARGVPARRRSPFAAIVLVLLESRGATTAQNAGVR